MSKPRSWAIRVTFMDGSQAFVRKGGVIGKGPIATFYAKEEAEKQAKWCRELHDPQRLFTVIERSHGRDVKGA